MLLRILETKTSLKITFIAAVATIATVGLLALVVRHEVRAQADPHAALNSKLQKLQNQIDNYQQSIAQTQEKSASLQNEIDIYDNQMAALQLQIDATKTQTEDTNLQITELQTQIDRRKAEIEQNKIILAELIRQLSLLDNNSFLQIGLGTNDFSSFLDQIEYNRSVQQQVYSLVSKIKDIQAKLEIQQEDLKKSLQKLTELAQQLSIAQDSLDQQRSDKAQLLAETRGSERNYQKLLQTSQSQEDQVQKELYDLDNAARDKVGNPNINAKKGSLAWPMRGVLTQGYGNTGFTSLGYNFHNGIDLAAPAGTPIYSPADGMVANCNSSQQAYGNWCSIYSSVQTDNGKADIVTLFGHMRTIVVSPGQSIKLGGLIGYEGNTGNTTRLLYGPDRGYHLHFTVFARKGYSVSKGAYGDYLIPSGVTLNPLSFLGS